MLSTLRLSGDEGVASILWILIAGTMGIVLFVVLFVVMLGGGSAEACGGAPGGVQPSASDTAENSIPGNYLDLYKRAGQESGVPWNVLAGVGKVETDHGRSKLPGVHSGENFAGAGGPMQFLQPTWDSFGVDGNGDGKKDRYDPADAIPGAANYLRHNGADKGGESLRKAIFAYNHSWDYVNTVLSWAKKYAGGDFSVGDANNAGAACPSGFGKGNWPPGSACPGGGAIGAEHITERMRCVRDQIKAKFTVPRGIGCYRSDGGIAGGGEHPLGRACDFMISSGAPSSEQVKLGYDIANWAQANAKALGIYYIIYRQHIWNPTRAREGWRQMEDRGSLTQNHYDHVHISVLA